VPVLGLMSALRVLQICRTMIEESHLSLKTAPNRPTWNLLILLRVTKLLLRLVEMKELIMTVTEWLHSFNISS
jgi:hypothetical protein